MVKLIINSHI